MKFLLVTFLFSSFCYAQTDVFQGTFEQLEKEASKVKKPYIVDFYTPWCGYCKKFNREVMPDSSFSALVNDQFLFGRVNGDANKDLVIKYKVRGFPTFLVFNKKGEIIKRFNGYVNARSFVKSLNYLGYTAQEKTIVSLNNYQEEKAKQLDFLIGQNERNEVSENAIKSGNTTNIVAKEDLIIDNPTKEKQINFYYDYGKNGFSIIKTQDALAIISNENAHQLVLQNLLFSKPKINSDYLVLINSLLLHDTQNYYLLDTKSYIHFQLGQTKNGKNVAKKAKKIAQKKGLDYSATTLLLTKK